MQELNYSDLDTEDGKSESVALKSLRIFGGLLSLTVLILIIVWTIKLVNREIEDLPVIKALDHSVRIKPQNEGGEAVKYKGMIVNEVLQSGEEQTALGKINLAPSEEVLDSGDQSPPVRLETPDFKDPKSISDAITEALKELLGEENKEDLDFGQAPKIQLGSYKNFEDASMHLHLLQKANPGLLENVKKEISEYMYNNVTYFRLRISGFENRFAAQELCSALAKFGEDCILVSE